ncbi:GNAT family N-acetyltransferase [Lactiplantibacillus sp. WILCCON 0030]|uniref:GNAT family N-acetyltransferase n=1 Tax=Lactiplantibacillus brownii TaxID=3069269 RepID=A0ABU1AAP7_9LACO|nr:GNAT family N-acetyltransferase [Lactiplantibacillus brownii]MDQ7938022.1 GNAT family N-acetyltransferase [Lactiplantibacillus brownii]
MTRYVRQATNADLPAMMTIIAQGRQALAAEQIPQWQGAYPQAADIQADITAKRAWLLIVDGKIAGTAALLTTPDPNYRQIYHGNWAGNANATYTSIHRIAIASGYHGQHLADFYFSNLMTLSYQAGFRQIRVDTHRLNQRMQHIITKAGFDYRGVVYMANDATDQRNAYQVML